MRSLLTACLFFFVTTCCWAGDPFSIRYLGMDQGLSNNAVTCMFQQPNGFMWFGTYDGLNKYDGYGFTVFRNTIGDSASLIDNHIHSINADLRNNIWIGTTKGLCIMDAARSVFYTPSFIVAGNGMAVPLSYEAVCVRRVDDRMLIGTVGVGLVVFEPGSRVGHQIASPLGSGKPYQVSWIEQDLHHGIIWVYVEEYGLCRYDPASEKITLVAHGGRFCNKVFVDHSGRVFVGYDSGVFLLEGDRLVRFTAIPVTNARDMTEDRSQNLWIATDGSGLWCMPAGSTAAEPFTMAEASLNSNAIYKIFIDKDGRKWLGTLRGGVNIIEQNGSLFKTISYNSKEKGLNDFILSFCEDDRSNCWIGTDGSGLRYWNRQNNSFTEFIHSADPNSISSNFITYITRDSYHDIWISTWFGGINKLVQPGNRFRHYSCYNPEKKTADNNIWFVFEDREKRLWASATNNGYLYQYNHRADSFELFDKSLQNFQVIAEDRQGALWGGNYRTLIKVDTLRKQHSFYDIGYTVRCIHEDRNHNFWIGTEGGGLLLFDRATGQYKRLTTKDGLPNNAILRMLEDRSGNLWLTTYYGLCRFTPATHSFRNFTQADGLQSNQFSFHAAAVFSTGDFLVGGIKGFNMFQPDSISDHKTAPSPVLTGLRIDNSPADLMSSIRVPFDKALLSLDFTAIEYAEASKLRYAYYLEGWDQRWNTANYSRTANYSHLQEGQYRFYVKVQNADGAWSDEKLLLSISVLPPWYRSWWAYCLYAIAAGSIIYIVVVYNRRQERLKFEVKYALLEKEKEREVANRKTAFFTHISHEFRAPLSLIINPLQDLVTEAVSECDQQKLLTTQRNAKRLLSLVDQLLLFGKADEGMDELKLRTINFSELAHEVFMCFVYQAKSKQIDYQFYGREEGIQLVADREKMEIILFNLISNALKYTPEGGRVGVRVGLSGQSAGLSVSDTGPGIDPAVGDRLFDRFYRQQDGSLASKSGFGIGLFLVKHFVVLHQGTVGYRSEAGRGTRFDLSIPHAGRVVPDTGDRYAPEETPIKLEILEELIGGEAALVRDASMSVQPEWQDLFSEKKSIVIVDDDREIRDYLLSLFSEQFIVHEAADGEAGWQLVVRHSPDLVISDLSMGEMSGFDLCSRIKQDLSLQHIPVILLTAASSADMRLKGLSGGVEDYITKPFDKEILLARVYNILRSRNALQQYFFDSITLKSSTAKISVIDKAFLETCIHVVEENIDNEDFTIELLMKAVNLSHSGLYKKIKAISGQSINSFIRLIRLRRAAVLLLSTDTNVGEACLQVGMTDVKYFRRQFVKLFGMPPTEYVKKYKSSFLKEFRVPENVRK